MSGKPAILTLAVACALPALTLASHNRGVDAQVDLGPTGAVVLTWIGGQAPYTISRSNDPRLVQVPGSEIGTTFWTVA